MPEKTVDPKAILPDVRMLPLMLNSVAAIVCFKVAFALPLLSLPAAFGFAVAVCRLSAATSRMAFYSGLTIGTILAGMELTFFHTVFGPGALGLWLILGLWLAVFLLSAAFVRRAFPQYGIWMLPILWIGFEYFRSELYYLRFSWVTPGLSLVGGPWQILLGLGQYAVGGLLFLVVVLFSRHRWTACAVTVALLLSAILSPPGEVPVDSQPGVVIAGMQLEHPSESMITSHLDDLVSRVPDADLLILSEYTFNGPVPLDVLEWCDDHDRYLVAGGKQVLAGGEFRNTAFVIGPEGSIVHRQAKAVPIQFFSDGLPAATQQLWNSPWGNVGLTICYDMSYARVVDPLVADGAQLILNPTMDPESWGAYEHQLHSRIPIARAAEYGVPVVRLASSGVSAFVSAEGKTLATGAFPGPAEIVTHRMILPKHGRRPPDRWIVLPCVIFVPICILAGAIAQRCRTRVSPDPR